MTTINWIILWFYLTQILKCEFYVIIINDLFNYLQDFIYGKIRSRKNRVSSEFRLKIFWIQWSKSETCYWKVLKIPGDQLESIANWRMNVFKSQNEKLKVSFLMFRGFYFLVNTLLLIDYHRILSPEACFGLLICLEMIVSPKEKNKKT